MDKNYLLSSTWKPFSNLYWYGIHEKGKIIIIQTSLIIIVLFSSFFLLLITITFFINENLVFSQQQNKYEDQKSVNQQNSSLDMMNIKHQRENFSSDLDIFGIKKIYPTKKGGFEWFMNNSDPESDPYLHNYKRIVKNEEDGSYNIGERSRMGVYSKDGIGYPKRNMETYDFTELSKKGYWYKPSDWKNVEITGEYLYREGEGPGITHYARSVDHSLLNNGCGGSSYKLKIHFDGTSNLNKELVHAKPWKKPKISHPFGDLKDKWFRFKGVMYNLQDGTVKLENWLDPYLNNTWFKIAEDRDSGGWGNDGEKCHGKEDQIITWGSPTATFRWDDVLIDFRNLSVREIQPPTP